ncbi:MAG: H-NS family nucleoid-associated regulatory protein [Desulfuromonadaceae bacterium]
MTSLKELIAQRDAIIKQIDETRLSERSDAINAALALISEHGLTQQDLFGSAASSVKKVKSESKAKVAAKYRDPVSGKQWSGRGLAPKWLAGKDRTEFLIS